MTYLSGDSETFTQISRSKSNRWVAVEKKAFFDEVSRVYEARQRDPVLAMSAAMTHNGINRP